MGIFADIKTPKELDPGKPEPGDIISARFRWSNDKDDTPGEKIRPCLIIKVGKDMSSIIVAPISTKQGWKAVDCVEIMPEDRKEAGLHSQKRSWVKLTEVNRIELPNMAVIPQVDNEGRLSWRRGRISDNMFNHITKEIGYRIADKSLKGIKIESDKGAFLKVVRVKKASEQELSSRGAEIARKRMEEENKRNTYNQKSNIHQR